MDNKNSIKRINADHSELSNSPTKEKLYEPSDKFNKNTNKIKDDIDEEILNENQNKRNNPKYSK